MKKDVIDKDKELTYQNRERLLKNRNLLFWYENLYLEISEKLIQHKKVLEIGSGTSPLKIFFPNVLTSDYLDLDYLDFSFDCHEIDKFQSIQDSSLDVVVLTNVIHHLYDPVKFLLALRVKLKPEAEVICLDPYPSFLSYGLYKLFHKEPMDFSIQEPLLKNQEGPLSHSNQAIPYLLFIKKDKWFRKKNTGYEWDPKSVRYYTFISYFLTGGISRNFHIPAFVYKLIYSIDNWMARKFPKIFASFFEVVIKYKGLNHATINE